MTEWESDVVVSSGLGENETARKRVNRTQVERWNKRIWWGGVKKSKGEAESRSTSMDDLV